MYISDRTTSDTENPARGSSRPEFRDEEATEYICVPSHYQTPRTHGSSFPKRQLYLSSVDAQKGGGANARGEKLESVLSLLFQHLVRLPGDVERAHDLRASFAQTASAQKHGKGEKKRREGTKKKGGWGTLLFVHPLAYKLRQGRAKQDTACKHVQGAFSPSVKTCGAFAARNKYKITTQTKKEAQNSGIAQLEDSKNLEGCTLREAGRDYCLLLLVFHSHFLWRENLKQTRHETTAECHHQHIQVGELTDRSHTRKPPKP